MSVSRGARRAAGRAVFRDVLRRSAALAIAGIAIFGLSGCMQGTVPLVGPDPADPGARVAGVTYRSTISPYTSLRPASPSGWKEQNRGVAPSPGKSE